MSLSTDFPELTQFLGGYLHEDWVDDYETADEAVFHFLSVARVEQVSAAKRELDAFMKLNLDDASLAEALSLDLGCSYYPPGDGLSCREWLSTVQALLTQHLAN